MKDNWLQRLGTRLTSGAPEPRPPDEPHATVQYVDRLLTHMLKSSLVEIALGSDQPLPIVRDDAGLPSKGAAPTYECVVNRLKVMSGIDPVPHPDTTHGRIERPRGDHVVVYTIRFEDRARPPACTLRVRVKRRAG